MADEFEAGAGTDGSGNPTDTQLSTPIADAATPSPAPTEGSQEPQAATPTPDAAQSTPPDADDYSDLYDKVDDEPAPVVDPNAPPPTPNALPPQITDVLAQTEFVKSPENVPGALRAADELYAVHSGKLDAGEFIDRFREINPERFKTILPEVAKYVDWARSQNLLPAAGAQPTSEHPEVAALRQEVLGFKTEKQQQEAQAQQQAEFQAVQKVHSSATAKLDTLTKGTWLEGEDIHDRVLAQMDKDKVDAKLARENYPEWEKKYETAFKKVKNSEIDRVKRLSNNIIQHRQRLRNTTPAAPGSGGARKGDGSIPDWKDYQAHGKSLEEFQMDYAKATGLIK